MESAPELERAVADHQAAVTIGHHAVQERNAIVLQLHDKGYTHRAIAEIMSRAAVEEGGEALSSDAVRKIIARSNP